MNRPCVRTVAVLFIALSLAACGGGGGGSAAGVPVSATLRIDTTGLPGSAVGAAYPATQLQASGATGAVAWEVVSGTLPTGIDLSSAGLLSGTSSSGEGTYNFTVEATDDLSTATQPLSIVLGDLQASVTSGQMLGDLWTGQPLSISATGQSGDVTFQILTNNSGGVLSNINAQAGTATYTPGATPDVTDVIRITDSASGSVSLDLDIVLSPVAEHTARFGTTDVWYLESEVKRGTHAYATDMHDALASIGLWPAGSTGPASNDFETLIETLVRVQILRELNLIYLRESDGAAGVDGLLISFPFSRPDAGSYSAPSPGSTLSGSSVRYSVMEFADAVGHDPGVLGVAFVDNNNDRHENDGGDDLGVLTDRVTSSFSGQQGARLLTGNPVTLSDEPILKALLYEQAMSGTRYNAIKTLLEYWSRAMAIVTAHEVGHSVGLGHNGSGGTLMASSISFSTSNLSTSNAVPLTADEVAALQADLPGPGKSTAPLSIFGPEVEDTGGERVALTAGSDG